MTRTTTNNNIKHLVDTFLIISCQEKESQANLFEACISASYPNTCTRTGSDSILPFATLPLAHDHVTLTNTYKLPRIHFFVITDERGQRSYGTTLTIYESFSTSTNISVYNTSSSQCPEIETHMEPQHSYIPKFITILSKAGPYYSGFRQYLCELYRASTVACNVPIESFVLNLTREIPAPLPSLSIIINILDSSIIIRRPDSNKPIAWTNVPFTNVFTSLSISTIITIVTALLTERQVLLISKHLTLLVETSEVVLSLLFPFEWPHLYVPALPEFLLPVLEAPMPYFCGIYNDDNDSRIDLSGISNECLIINLDEDVIKYGVNTPELPALPIKRKMKLEKGLKESAGHVYRNSSLKALDDAYTQYVTPSECHEESTEDKKSVVTWDIKVQEAFMRFHVALLKSYRKYLVFPDENNVPGFQTKAFLSSLSSDFKPYLKELCQTQLFDTFITKRLYDPGAQDVIFFDQSIDAKLNRSKLKVKKRETPYLVVNIKNTNIVAPVPVYEDAEGGEFCFEYPTFPSFFDEDLFGTPRPMPTKVEEEMERQRHETLRLRSKLPQQQLHQQVDVSTSVEGASFTVFCMTFCSIVGREIQALAANGDHNSSEAGEAVSNEIFSLSLDTNNGEAPPSPAASNVRKTRIMGLDTPERLSHEVCDILKPVDSDNDDQSSVPPPPPVSPLDEISPNKNISTPSSSPAKLHGNAPTRNITRQSPFIRRKRFFHSVTVSQLEEARAIAKTQLDLAFESLYMMRRRKIDPDSNIYKYFIEACGRVGNTARATQLMQMMHQEGLMADSAMYSCLLSAFSLENAVEKHGSESDAAPIWTNGASGSNINWNQLRKKSGTHGIIPQTHNEPSIRVATAKSSALLQSIKIDSHNDTTAAKLAESSPGILASILKSATDSPRKAGKRQGKNGREVIVTEGVRVQVELGEIYLGMLYPDLTIDVESESCPHCGKRISYEDVSKGWVPKDTHAYTTKCPTCFKRFVARFTVRTSSKTFHGTTGKGTALYCEFLSPWVLYKEFINIKSKKELSYILDPRWRCVSKNPNNATLWWNLIITFVRYRLPITFLVQGNQRLITPLPESD